MSSMTVWAVLWTSERPPLKISQRRRDFESQWQIDSSKIKFVLRPILSHRN